MEVFFTNFTQWAGTNKSYALRSCRAGFLSALVCHTPVKEKGSCLIKVVAMHEFDI